MSKVEALEDEGGRRDGGCPASLEPPDLNRLRWHCRRGMLELDLVLARFLEEKCRQLTAQQRQEFERLLDLEDQALWQRISGEAAAMSGIEQMLRDCLGN
jgi:antitoxin CptB